MSTIETIGLIIWVFFGIFNVGVVFLTEDCKKTIESLDWGGKIILFLILFVGGGFVLSFSLKIFFSKDEEKTDEK